MLKKILNVLNGKKGEILINIVLLVTLKTGIKVNSFNFEMDSRWIERVQTDNDLTVDQIIEIKGGQFVDGFTQDTHCVGRNIRRKVRSGIDNPKRVNTHP